MSSPEADRVAFLADCYQQAASRATWSFAQGLILGQLSVIALLIVCVRYLLLEDSRKAQAEEQERLAIQRKLQAARRNTDSSRPRRTSIVDILDRIGYQLHNYQPESCEWLNVLLAQALEQFRSDAHQDDRILNEDVRPSFISRINVTEVSLGQDYPIFQDACIQPSPDHDGICAEIAFEFHDQITLAFDTRLVLNWPRAMLAALPVSLGLSVVKFSGTLLLELIPGERPSLSVSVAPDFTLGFAVKSLIGHRTKVRDLPKVTELIAMKLRAVFAQLMVAPNRRLFSIPDLWPRSSQTDRSVVSTSQDPNIGSSGNGSNNNNIGNNNSNGNEVDVNSDNAITPNSVPHVTAPRRRHNANTRSDITGGSSIGNNDDLMMNQGSSVFHSDNTSFSGDHMAGGLVRGGQRSVAAATEPDLTTTSTPNYSQMASPLRSPTLYGQTTFTATYQGSNVQGYREISTATIATGVDDSDRTRPHRRPYRASSTTTPSATLVATTASSANNPHHQHHHHHHHANQHGQH
ncbi:hypothetical protein BDF19DRAFT_444929 [Syncephalis fuscata]|nr:hypothetical protein BDF19DRAFT_444929 [Syncephalis fuscata]